MEKRLFREEAINFQRERLIGDIVIFNPVSWLYITIVLVTVALIIVTFITFGTYTRKETVAGYLTPSRGLVDIYPSRVGVTSDVYLDAGNNVKLGDRLVKVIVTPDATSNEGSTSRIESSLSDQLAILNSRKDTLYSRKVKVREQYQAQLSNILEQITQVDRQLSLQEKHVSILEDRFSSIKSLYAKSLISKEESERARELYLNEMKSIELIRQSKLELIAQSEQVKNEILLVDENYKVELSQTEAEIEQVRQRIESLHSEKEYVITSPVDGTIVSLHEYSGQRVRMDKPILSILPKDSEIEAELLIPSTAIGFIKIGQQVRLRYHSFPHQRFGSYMGEIKKISKTLLRPDQVDVPIPIGTSVYRARVALTQSQISAYGEEYPLQVGMSLEASIFLEERPLYEWIISPIRSLKGSI